jgi:hypothetical protein
MAKIRVNGETFDFDGTKKPMSEALALENALGMRYVDWETELQAGSMKAMCGFVWLVWRREGRDVALEDILSGDVEIDLAELLESLAEAGEEAQAAAGDPTDGAPAPAPSPSTRTATSARSASSASARGKSGS